ncbi:MAG TPA: hypothetical protein VFW47_18350 [Phenylobacterium sp.]|nr:hypothetical protein [Phenylobacterium sp.]
MPEARSIFLATPCYGGLAHIHFMGSVLALQRACAEKGVGLEVELGGGDALITRARASMAAKFLAGQATHLLFVDADIGFTPDQVFRLLDADRDLVGGVYPLKQVDWAKARQAALDGLKDIQAASVGYVVRFIPSPTNSVEVDDDGFGPVAYVGTGFMLIKRRVVQAVAEAHPELTARLRDLAGYAPDGAVMMFETMIEAETGEYLSEDYAFCRRWRDLGGEVFADFHSRLTHVGHAAYSGSLADAQAR